MGKAVGTRATKKALNCATV